MRIALAQSHIVSAQPGPYQSTDDPFQTLKINLNNAAKDVQRAKAEGADIVCFEEYCLQGILGDGRQYLSLPAQWLEARLSELAKEYEIAITGTIVYGSSEALPPLPSSDPFASSLSTSSASTSSVSAELAEWRTYLDKAQECLADTSHFTLLNKAIYIDSQGERIGTYTKKNLWHPEREYLEPGTEEDPIFETPWGKAGFLVCWDLSHPAAAQKLADQGVDIIFAPAYWLSTDSEPMLSHHNPHPSSYEPQLLSSLCAARAFETETILIHTNPGGETSDGFMGGSAIWAPLMGKVGGWNVGDAGVGVRVIDVDVRILKDARDTYKIREDAASRNAT